MFLGDNFLNIIL